MKITCKIRDFKYISRGCTCAVDHGACWGGVQETYYKKLVIIYQEYKCKTCSNNSSRLVFIYCVMYDVFVCTLMCVN